MPKVLIITYYWPPSGGSGVQRWLKFAKYLPQFGWEPVIYTPENPDFALKDETLLKDVAATTTVIRTKIWEPYQLFNRLTGKKTEKANVALMSEKKGNSRLQKLAMTLRGNLLIPDPRCFWIKPSVKFLTEYLKDHPVDAIVTTGPPHSMHMIGLGLHKQTNIPWIADFRDPWTNIDFYKDLHLTWLADKIHRHKEQRVVQQADAVIVVSDQMKREYEQLLPKRIDLIYNGFDNDDCLPNVTPTSEQFTISHIGLISQARNPNLLWKVLSELIAENAVFGQLLHLKLVGKTDTSVKESITHFGLLPYVTLVDHVSHDEAIRLQSEAQVLLLLINRSPNAKGIITGKLFEYLAAEKVILAIGPSDGDVASILNKTQAGTTIDFDDEKRLKATLLAYFERFQNHTLQPETADIRRFSRKSLSVALVQVLNELHATQSQHA